MALRDQRRMVGPVEHETPADVEAAWRRWVDGDPDDPELHPPHRLVLRERRGDFSTDLRESGQVVVAYVSGGKWIGDCPNCNGGVPAWIENPRGCCLDCGTIFQVDMPSDADVERAEELLSGQPPTVANWWRHKGETLDEVAEIIADLAVEPAPLVGSVSLADVERLLGEKAIDRLRQDGVISG